MAILVRKGRGRPKLARYKGSDEIVWAEIEGLGRTIHVAAVYIVPIKSTRYKHNVMVRRELEEDIVKFSRQGMVIVMGDLNSRIGDHTEEHGVPSDKKRENIDKIVNENGRE